MEVNPKKIFVMAFLIAVFIGSAQAMVGGSFDQFGYNYRARTFVGSADGVDRIIDGLVWGGWNICV